MHHRRRLRSTTVSPTGQQKMQQSQRAERGYMSTCSSAYFRAGIPVSLSWWRFQSWVCVVWCCCFLFSVLLVLVLVLIVVVVVVVLVVVVVRVKHHTGVLPSWFNFLSTSNCSFSHGPIHFLAHFGGIISWFSHQCGGNKNTMKAWNVGHFPNRTPWFFPRRFHRAVSETATKFHRAQAKKRWKPTTTRSFRCVELSIKRIG